MCQLILTISVFWNGRTEKHQTSTARFRLAEENGQHRPFPSLACVLPHPLQNRVPRGERAPVALCCEPTEPAGETKSFCPCHKTGENTGFSPVFFLHVLYGNGVHFGSDTWFSHPVLPVLNRFHPLQHPKRTRLQLFSPEIGCVSLFLPSFDLQKFRAGFSQTSGLSSHSYRFILTRPFPDAMIRIPAFLS